MNKIVFIIIVFAFISCNNNDNIGKLEVADGEIISIKKGKTFTINGTNEIVEMTLKNFNDSCADVKIIGRTFLTTEYFVGSICITDTAFISYHNTSYYIFFKEIDDYLFGRDNFNFEIARVGVPKTSNQNQQTENTEQKVDEFLSFLEKTNFTFIRNGSKYTAQEAAEHLRNKYNSQQSEISTFEDFVTKIATKSSFSGEDYQVIVDNNTLRFADWVNREYLKIN